jgi:hypothetical protein
LIIGALVLTLIYRAGALPEQTVAARYNRSVETDYAQISIFQAGGWPYDKAMKQTYDLNKTTSSLVKNIRGDAVSAAFSTRPTDIVFESRDDRGRSFQSTKLTAYFTGGDFFLFHPYEILSGNYLDENTLMSDNAVLDENAAWQLFGSTDIAGRFIYAGETPVHISGVIKRFNTDDLNTSDDDEDTKPFIYLNYQLATALTGAEPLFTTYEAVLPSPVPGAALDTVKQSLGMADGLVSTDRLTRLVDNTARSEIGTLFEILRDIPGLAVRDDAIELPAWENEARVHDVTSALILALLCVIAVLPTVSFIILIVISIRFIKRKLNKAVKHIRGN